MNDKYARKKETLSINDNIIYLYEGDPLYEFCIQAIPCYLFFIAFAIRYLAIKDLGFPKRLSFGYLLILKLVLTMGIMLVRLLQILAAFQKEEYWLSHAPFYSLLYIQFIAAHGLSLYLLVLQHLKRLPEVCYCQNLFWGMSLAASIIFIKVQADNLSIMFDASLIMLKTILFLVGFVKRRTYVDFSNSSRPLIREDEWAMSGIGYSELSILSKKTGTIAKINDKSIDFKFRTKLVSYQGTILFEFRVYLPRYLYGATNDLELALGSDYLGAGQYILKKSLTDFFTLSSHINNKFGREAPKLDSQIFRNRLRGDQTKIMTKSIKIFEDYMKKLGKNYIFWDEIFLRFLKIYDSRLQKRLNGISVNSKDKEQDNQDQISRLYQSISVIDNYEGDHKDDKNLLIQTHNEIFTIAHRNTFADIFFKLIDIDYERIKLKIKVSEYEWQITRRRDQWNEILKLSGHCQDIEQLSREVNDKGPSIELLFFIDYFSNMNKSPVDYAHHLFQTNGYQLQSVIILNSKFEVDELGQSVQRFDLAFNIMIISMQRFELLYLNKSFKDIKKFVKQVRSEMKFDDFKLEFPIRGQSFVRSIQEQSRVVAYLVELFNDQDVRQLDTSIQFLSDIENQYDKVYYRHTNTGGMSGHLMQDLRQSFHLSDLNDMSQTIQGFMMSREDSDLLDNNYDMMLEDDYEETPKYKYAMLQDDI